MINIYVMLKKKVFLFITFLIFLFKISNSQDTRQEMFIIDSLIGKEKFSELKERFKSKEFKSVYIMRFGNGVSYIVFKIKDPFEKVNVNKWIYEFQYLKKLNDSDLIEII